MSGTSIDDFFRRQAREARGPEPERKAGRRLTRARLVRRIALGSVLAMVVGVGAVAGGGYLAIRHVASSVHRIPGIAALTAANQPVMPAATRKSITILVTGAPTLPAHRGGHGADHSSTAPEAVSGLITLVHLNASDRAGAVVSVPGFGRRELSATLKLGGPSLLIRTVEHLTNVRINDYSVVDFAGLQSVIGAMGGVTIDAPFNMVSEGHVFPKGIDHLSAADVLPYVTQQDVSEIGREELQSGLIRSILDNIAQHRLFSRVGTDFRVLDSMAGALSVDSNMSDSKLESLGLRLGHLKGRDGTFVTAPSTGSPLSGGTEAVHLTRLARQLWAAIRHDSVAAFARRHPSTLTPGAPA
jgi:LCP family protein required for cell wall assembly